jgi:hypothetical protein
MIKWAFDIPQHRIYLALSAKLKVANKALAKEKAAQQVTD